MMETKYTSDGRKVAVLGKLNSEQHIVQEIFIADGQEIPSGENFVVSSLHDSPVESHKERRLRALEERADRAEQSCKEAIEQARKREYEAVSKAKLRADALFAFAKNSDDQQLQRLYAFLSGEITHLFINSYSPEIIEYKDDNVYNLDCYRDKRYEGLKLVTIFGSSDGHLDYRISAYSDGSGGTTEIIPCRSYDEALAEAQKAFDKKAEAYLQSDRGDFLSFEKWEAINGIVIPDEVIKKFNLAKRKAKDARIAKLREELKNLESE